MRKINLIGMRFGRLVVLSEAPRPSRSVHPHWLCRCDCGTELVVSGSNLRHKHSTSCGCRSREALAENRTTHGMSDTPENKCWQMIRNRCTNPDYQEYHLYGGRGITVCEAWSSFERFYEDVGPRPSLAHSIDRIDNEKGYEPGNVRWATKAEQARNRRSNIRVLLRGSPMVLSDAALRLGLDPKLLIERHRRLCRKAKPQQPFDVSILLKEGERALAEEVRRVQD